MGDGRIISVVNNKGGVGKTTITLNLAHAMALQGKRTLIVDMDSQCNATSMFDLGRCVGLYELLAPISDPNAKDYQPSQCIYTTSLGCSILPNAEETAFLEADFYRHDNYLTVLREKLRQYAIDKFDITFIDCPPSMGAFVYAAMIASDCIIVPIKSGSKYSLDGITRTIHAINEVRKSKLNEDLILLKFLYNKANMRRVADQYALRVLEDNYPGQIFNEVIPETTSLQVTEMGSQTIFQWAPRSKIAQKFRDLAKETMSYLDEL